MKMYGIKNCDTVKKACKRLEDNGVEFEFHDYKKQPPTEELLRKWCENIGIDLLINKRGTTYKKLSEEQKQSVNNEGSAIKIMIENPSIIKRPILFTGNKYIVGFNEEDYKELTNNRILA